jgi:hypothetical protein
MEENETPNEGTGDMSGALAAIDEALGIDASAEGEGEGTSELEGEGEGADEGDTQGDTEGDAEGEGEGEGDEETPEAKAAKVAADKAKGEGERGPDGKFKKAGEERKPDPINDPIPKDLKESTRERMQSLITMTKEVTAERDRVSHEFKTIIGGIEAAGATPEQYGETLSWLQLFNSPEPQARRQAYELVESVADRLATMLGIDRAAPDPFKDHADLKDAVTKGQVTAQYAREIARNRNAAKFTGDIQNNVRQQQTQQQTQENIIAQSRADLNAFEAKMKAEDPLYDRKKAAILPTLRETLKFVPREQWATAFANAYAKAQVAPRGRSVPGPKSGQQPMRAGKNPAGGQSRPAASALEAMNGALASMKG